jgi:hypothetical protein
MSTTGAGHKVIPIKLARPKRESRTVAAKQLDSGSAADFFDWIVTGFPTLQSVAPQHD